MVTAPTAVATLPPLATVADLETHLGRPLTAAEKPQAEQWLAAASTSIRRATGQTLTVVTGDRELHDGQTSRLLLLDQLPVRQVVSVEVEGQPLEPDIDWRLKPDTGALWRLAGFTWWADRQGIVAVYDHGYEPLPADLVTLCCGMATRAMQTPPGDFRLEQLGPYRYDRREVAGLGAIGMTTAERDVIDLYTARRQTVP